MVRLLKFRLSCRKNKIKKAGIVAVKIKRNKKKINILLIYIKNILIKKYYLLIGI